MKNIALILGGFLFAVQIFQPLQAENSVKEPSVSHNWLVLGDSLSAAYGIETEQGWVALLQQTLRQQGRSIQVVNASISGETTSGGKHRLPALLKQYQPKLMILELGANDALRGQNLAITKRNLEQMIVSCIEASFSCQPVLLGIRLPTNYGPAYDKFLQKIYADLAQKYRLPFDPFFLETVALDPDLMQADALHPNEKAQPLILERVLKLLPIKDF